MSAIALLSSAACAINTTAQVTGYITVPEGGIPTTHVFRTHPGQSVNYSTYDLQPGDLNNGVGQAINASGEVAGTVSPPSGDFAFRSDVSPGTTLHNLGTLGGIYWRLAISEGVVGFNLYHSTHRLNRHLILVHAIPSYHYRTHWTGQGAFALHVVLWTGQDLLVPIA